MRKLGIKLLLFGTGFLLLIKIMGGFDNIDRETNINQNIIRIANAHHFDSLDILFVGSSASYSGINPAYFDSVGLRTYNVSIASGGPYFYELLVNDYLRSARKKPKAIFILVMPTTFSGLVDDFYEIGIHRYLQIPVSNETVVRNYTGWKKYPHLLVKSFQKGTKNLLHKERSSPVTIQQVINDKGFFRSQEQTSAAKEKKESSLYTGLKLQQFKHDKLVSLQNFAQAIKAKGIEVVFFTLPGNKSSTFFNPSFIAEYKAAELQLKKDWKFIDVSGLQMDSTAYRNIDHMNTHGAAIVSTKVVAEIVNDRELWSILKER